MEVDWGQAKRLTLWSYEDLGKKLLQTLAYDFVREHYNHTMKGAQAYARKVQQGYLKDKSDSTYIGNVITSFKRLDGLRVKTYLDLIQQVETREKCEAFLCRNDFDFGELIQMLNYIFRWVLPLAIPVRELVDVGDETQKAYLEKLKQHRLGSNLDILEQCRTPAGRTRVARITGIPKPFILDLAHRADISRLAYVRGKTIKHLCGGGYDTLNKIADADLIKMEEEMDAYYKTLGKSLDAFKAVVPLWWMIGGAQVLPRVIKK